MAINKDIIPKVWTDQIFKAQLERESIILKAFPTSSLKPNPNFRSKTTELINTVAEFKQFLVNNNIPDNAEFYDTGYEADGRYDFTWEVKTSNE